MIGQTDANAVFFDLVHSMVKSDPTTQEQERRRHDRLSYNCVQLVATFDGQNLPTQAEFMQVHCLDLSERGICFMLSQQPNHVWFVVALHAMPFVFVKAKVCTVLQVDTNGSTEYRIGCEFVGKIEA